ncbi:MAG: hypothetical protein ACYDCC_09335 [Actinomycetota bacterium]
MKRLLVIVACLSMLVPLVAGAQPPPQQNVVSLDRSVEPVILKGSEFPTWSAGEDPTFREPQAPGNPGALGGGVPADPLMQSDCRSQVEEDGSTDHNCYQSSRIPHNPLKGAPVDRILGYRWVRPGHSDGHFEQIPFQVDKRFTRYISNNASDFGAYSGVDQHNTYQFDREGFRYTWDQLHATGSGSPCLAVPRPGSTIVNGYATTLDPVQGLNDDDEMVFMMRDAGSLAPSDQPLPKGIESAYRVKVVDPTNPLAIGYVYVMLAAPDGPRPEFTAANSPYIHYQRDANADLFVYSQSSYSNYGNAPKGPYCNADGTLAAGVDPFNKATWKQRRPLDGAWVKTPRYEFRYDGRWLMTQLHIANNSDGNYGPNLIDRWKARAFAQDPGSHTPCCGYEEEATNWGGSSILMGERWGPVRVIRETWGADSSTNNARREVFYPFTIDFGDALRVHPIPPLDGIYVQWDHAAGQVSQYFNPSLPNGIPIDGSNTHDLYGNFDDPCNTKYDSSYHSQIDSTYRSTYQASGLCGISPYHQSINVVDLTTQGAQGTLQWEEVTGANGTMVSRWTMRDVTPGGAAQGIFALPYYRDDSCFDDGTGNDPGPKLHLRSANEPTTWGYDASGTPVSPAPTGSIAYQRKCWTPADGLPNPSFSPQGDIRYYQGSIGTHGLHLMFIAESDNADQTVPVDEIDSVQKMVLLPGCVSDNWASCNVGDRYGRSVDFPLQTIAVPLDTNVEVSTP